VARRASEHVAVTYVPTRNTNAGAQELQNHPNRKQELRIQFQKKKRWGRQQDKDCSIEVRKVEL
jgi:hypothetical protein